MLTIGTIIAFASLYYKWGEMEYGSGFLMGALSSGVSGMMLFMFPPYKLFAVFGAQVLLGILFFGYHFTRPMKKNI